MAEYIDRDELYEQMHVMGMGFDLIEALEMIENFPATDVAPVAHGKWIRHKPEGVIFADYECSVCSAYPTGGIKSYYCPNCGAKMDY